MLARSVGQTNPGHRNCDRWPFFSGSLGAHSAGGGVLAVRRRRGALLVPVRRAAASIRQRPRRVLHQRTRWPRIQGPRGWWCGSYRRRTAEQRERPGGQNSFLLGFDLLCWPASVAQQIVSHAAFISATSFVTSPFTNFLRAPGTEAVVRARFVKASPLCMRVRSGLSPESRRKTKTEAKQNAP